MLADFRIGRVPHMGQFWPRSPCRNDKKKIAHSVDVQRRVVVETFDGRRLQGVISEAGADDFMLVYAGRATTLSYSDVRKLRWQSPVWKHAKAVAAAAGVTVAIFGLVVLLGGLKG